MEAGPVDALGDGIHCALVDFRAEVTESLGRRLNASVGEMGGRDEGPGGVVIASRIRVSKGRDPGVSSAICCSMQAAEFVIAGSDSARYACLPSAASPVTVNPASPTGEPTRSNLHAVQ